jgi:hypothetical protein
MRHLSEDTWTVGSHLCVMMARSYPRRASESPVRDTKIHSEDREFLSLNVETTADGQTPPNYSRFGT